MTEKLTIESMAYEGAGVAHTSEGKAVFVDGAVVGDVVEILSVRKLPTYDKCERFELVEPSPHRVQPLCPYGETCGGCPWQILDYEEQLAWKRRFVVDAFERIGKLGQSEQLVAACNPSPLEWHYRNKIELHAFCQEGKVGLGLRKKQSHEHVRTDECLLLPKALAALPGKLAGALTYSLREEREKLVRVAIRSSLTTGSTEVALVMLPSGVNRGLLAKTLSQNADLTSLVRVITEGEIAERKVKQVEVLKGAGCWQEELAGNSYKVSAPSFFQVNSGVAAQMITWLTDLTDDLELPKTASVVDLYSGVGTFTMPLAKRFERVRAIESYGSSVRDLMRNLDEQRLHAQVIGGDVARELPHLPQSDLAVIDPPRSGLKSEALDAVLAHGAPQLVYVSCNPATMARDIKRLVEGGYELVKAAPFDQFPQSYHVEIMAQLSKTS